MSTITNPDDPSQTYTYGQRGRKPLWVQEYELTNPAPEKPKKPTTPKINPVDADDCEHKITFDSDTQTLTNHTLGKTYRFGQRGQRPAWVRAWAQENQAEVQANENHTVPAKPNRQPNKPQHIRGPGGLREWHFKSEMNNKCIIVAKDPMQACVLHNQHSKFQLTPYALKVFWRETDYMCGFKEGMWRAHPTEDAWESYSDYRNRLNAQREAVQAKYMEAAEAEEVAAMDHNESMDEAKDDVVEEEWTDEALDAALDAFAEDEAHQEFD